jgi:hypothetical protein
MGHAASLSPPPPHQGRTFRPGHPPTRPHVLPTLAIPASLPSLSGPGEQICAAVAAAEGPTTMPTKMPSSHTRRAALIEPSHSRTRSPPTIKGSSRRRRSPPASAQEGGINSWSQGHCCEAKLAAPKRPFGGPWSLSDQRQAEICIAIGICAPLQAKLPRLSKSRRGLLSRGGVMPPPFGTSRADRRRARE